MSLSRYRSWGRYPNADHEVHRLRERIDDVASLPKGKQWLPFGNGRSYGDSCLNDGGLLLDTRGLDRFIAFDHEAGILRCEAGVLLSEILDLIVPQGWFLPVTPGTQFVTVGGAIANDVHGKNHHRAGTFGCHVNCFELLRSDSSHRVCSADTDPELYRATIGGLGLTGLIEWAEIRLRPIQNAFISTETIRFEHLDKFWQLAAESDREFEYTVAWIDCLSGGSGLGRGLMMRGNHSQTAADRESDKAGQPLNIPFELPFSLVNRVTLRGFNTLYYRKQLNSRVESTTHFRPFFYPLDSVGNWNRVYGKRGFLQYQCVVPMGSASAAIADMLTRIARSGQGSFLAVLKVFGDIRSPGMLSFPRPGATLALDFPFLGEKTLKLLDCLDAITIEAGGAVYPAKDARMSPPMFRQAFPAWRDFGQYIDPQFSSSFWRRVTGERT